MHAVGNLISVPVSSSGCSQLLCVTSCRVCLHCRPQALKLGNAMTAHPHVLPATADSPQRLVTWVWRRLVGVPLLSS